MNKVEQWKQAKHGLDVWNDLLEHARNDTPMKRIDETDLERMKWYGVFYRKRDGQGTYMLRVRVTGCELSAEQAKCAALIAYEFGYGIVDVTTRANLQIQGLSLECVPEALARLEAAGLTCQQTGHDNVRNVFGHPLSGEHPRELFDTRALCREISALFLHDRALADLPRKMNIAISGLEEHGLHYWSQDISFLAARNPEGEVGFLVLLGGTQGQNPHLGWHLPVWVAPDQVVQTTAAILHLFRNNGSREKRDQARLRYLVEQIGIAGVLEHLARTLPFPLQPWIQPPLPPTTYDDLIGWFPQRTTNRWALGLAVPLGRLAWNQLEAAAVLSQRWGQGRLRTTHDQRLLILDIPSGFRAAAATAAAACRLSPHADSIARNTVACTGRQFCNIAVTETKGQMLQLMDRLRQRGVALEGIRIHMSGCPSSCAQHHTADIGLKGVRVRRLLGTREGYDVTLGGGLSGQVHLGLPYRLGVDVDQLPQLIDEVVAEYYLQHVPGETFSMYWRRRLADIEARRVEEVEYQPPTWICEGCGHRHRGEDPPVFCPQCAGLRRLYARLDEGPSLSADLAVDTPALPDTIDAPSSLASTPTAPTGFVHAARLADIPESRGLLVTIAGQEYALFRVASKIMALDNACPHAGGSLAEGQVEQGAVTCPLHGWTFDLCRGHRLDAPTPSVAHYRTQVVGDHVFIDTQATMTPELRRADSAASPRSASTAQSNAPVT